ncbi:hypothetical protein D9757_009660 [Collybiopsis confluens]|uniref:Uncharacterized protein n=1 Tax=Collybiopsis confluens TaxID=2823264 RepID=A0A8H5H260_9AGAR|nr:hypothetical protein D9757_009660 [Collybiopsis confluens]
MDTEQSASPLFSDGERRGVHKVEKLDVEDEDARAQRLESIFMKLSSGGATRSAFASGLPNFQFDFGERKTWAVEPPSELLSRVQAFLPQMEASNAILAQRVKVNPTSVDMEHIEDGEQRYIEMNLGLGVFDMKPKGESGKRDRDTEMTDSSASSSSSSSSSFSSSSSSSNSSEDSDSATDAESDSDIDSEEILSSFIPSSFLSRTSSSSSSSSSNSTPATAAATNTSTNPSSFPGGKPRVHRMIRPLPRRYVSLALADESNSDAKPKPSPSIVVLSETVNSDSSMESQ